eukprot:GHVL01010357.1.p1 GENE.GHVL01010357.1~~GHVL01010357.1.p1  ORF type:complete len:904 (-),score=58.57 GHVL01010357.1:169-2880(-)
MYYYMCKIYENPEICEDLYEAENNQIEVLNSEIDELVMSAIRDYCACRATYRCPLCDFLVHMSNCRGIVDFDQMIPTHVQSAPADLNAPDPGSNAAQEQNVGFDDDMDDAVVELRHNMSHMKVDTSQNVALGDFLKRPVQIFNYDWQIGTSVSMFSTTISPWHAFFNKTSIKKKLDNYYLLRCNLHVKFVINASPFYYGCLLAGYQPLANFNPSPIRAGPALEEIIPLSQRPHVYLYPQDSQGGEIVLPFLYHKNWLDATSATDLVNMGTIALQSIGPLMNANGLTSDTIEIMVYAWAEDVEVAGPTVALAVQSKPSKQQNQPHGNDEYSDGGIVSKPATAIAHAAGMLKNIPVIGQFATATQYAAEGVSKVAALFGFTNTPVIDDVHQFQPAPFPNLAATDIGMPIDKLTWDAKNELSIDPSIGGVTEEDELQLVNILQRESYLGHYTWASTNVTNDGLFYSRVSPVNMRRPAITGGRLVYYTPACYVSKLFEYWRGDIIFRFKFICSKYHRGRVRINWDPHGDIGTAGDYTTETYTRIVDITECTDVEFRVPYTQALAYLTVPNDGEFYGQTGTSTSNVGVEFNGILTMRVLNKQSSPVSSADILVVAYARCAENFEFAAPHNQQPADSPYAVQSKPFDKAESDIHLGAGPSEADPNINLIYMGETIKSLRTLFRRQCLYRRFVHAGTSIINTIFKTTHTISRSPLYPGYDPDGLNTVTGAISGVNEPYNWVNWHPLSWMSLCFVGHRGSYVYTVNVNGQQNAKTVRVQRKKVFHDATNISVGYANNGGSLFQALPCVSLNSGIEGTTMTNQETQAGITALLPMYSNYKFQMNSSLFRTLGSSDDGSINDSLVIEHMYQTQTDSWNDVYTDVYLGAGPDFSLIFFLNAPVLYSYSAFPTPV